MDKELLDFIAHHKLNINDFFDAKGRNAAACYDEMKAQNKLFSYNSTPCLKYGHKVRDRKGTCIICHPKTIIYSIRKNLTGNVYIACSTKKELTKIGMTTEAINVRLSKLNSRKVGNTDDWEMLFSAKCEMANSKEFGIQMKLSPYQVKGDYYGDTESKELFRCSFQKAKESFDLYIAENNFEILEQKFHCNNLDRFRFRNLKNI